MTLRTRYWLLQALGWGAYSAVGAWFALVSSRVLPNVTQSGWTTALVIGYVLFFCYSIALTDAFRRVMIANRWLDRSSWRLWLRLAAGVFTIGAIQVFLVVSISIALLPPGVWSPGSVIGLAWSVTSATGMWTALYVRLTERRRQKAREVASELTLREAELRALQQQVNPHFLFNCLNSIRALVIEDPPRAQEMITRLANMMRYSLARQVHDTVPLASEMEIASDYLALEAVRFEERLRVRVDVDPAVRDVQVPPMILPTLVENAVKHGIAAGPAGGAIDIRAAGDGPSLRLEVTNTGRLGEPRVEALGLANVRERLRLLYGDRASLTLATADPGRVVATVILPCVR
jgi:two-component system, LytTR family, sensor histidine kinase AlgZ